MKEVGPKRVRLQRKPNRSTKRLRQEASMSPSSRTKVWKVEILRRKSLPRRVARKQRKGPRNELRKLSRRGVMIRVKKEKKQ